LERDALWRKLVDIKYGSMRGGWCSKEVGGPYGVGVWKCIRRGWAGFMHHVQYQVDDGSKVLVWHDVWCEELPLKVFFQSCSLLHVVRIRGWRRICRSKMVTFIGIFCLLDLCMIGRLKWYLDSMSCALKK
jgi:hypothetical protein